MKDSRQTVNMTWSWNISHFNPNLISLCDIAGIAVFSIALVVYFPQQQEIPNKLLLKKSRFWETPSAMCACAVRDAATQPVFRPLCAFGFKNYSSANSKPRFFSEIVILQHEQKIDFWPGGCFLPYFKVKLIHIELMPP